jgi:HEAT repeat protein
MAIPALMTQLSSSSNEQVQHAALALADLAQGSRANKAAIAAQPGAIPTLVEVLGSSNEAVHANAALVLGRLADGSLTA